MASKKHTKLNIIDVILIVLFYSIIIIAMEKLKWEAAKILIESWYLMLTGCVGIIIGEFLKYWAVRHIRKILNLK